MKNMCAGGTDWIDLDGFILVYCKLNNYYNKIN